LISMATTMQRARMSCTRCGWFMKKESLVDMVFM
jgi:hypothetical protein